MTPIVTLTLNPAVDKSTRVQNIVPERKLSCEAPKYEPGGGGINVSRALKRLGTASLAVFPAGGRSGELLQELLKKEEIEQGVVTTRNETRENFAVVDISNNQQYRFGMPGPQIYPDEAGQFISLLQRLSPGWLVMSGSLPEGLEDDFYARIVREMKKLNCKIILDTSGDALGLTVNEGLYLIKPNLGELSRLVGVESLDHESVSEACRELIGSKKCEVVVVSMGAQGAYLASKDYQEHIATPAVKKQSTIGAGDSMVGGMIHELAKGSDLRAVLRRGVACGTAATMNPGTELFRPEDAEKLFQWLQKKGLPV